VRIARAPTDRRPAPAEPSAEPAAAPPTSVGPPAEVRLNTGATRRAVRLSVVFVLGIAGVYALLVALTFAGPAAGSAGASQGLLWSGVAAVLVAVAGAVVSLGSAPRAVELGEGSTVVVGRFGHRYAFPGRYQLRTTVLRRFRAGPMSPVPMESVEIAGGTSRRSFLIDEGLLATAGHDPAASP